MKTDEKLFLEEVKIPYEKLLKRSFSLFKEITRIFAIGGSNAVLFRFFYKDKWYGMKVVITEEKEGKK
jgi:hypothetical protein